MNRNRQLRKSKLLYRPEFLARLSVLLNEGYTFHESLRLLLPHHMKDYEIVLSEIGDEFRKGYGVTHILGRLGFPSRSLLPIVIAEIDGRLADAISSMAIYLKKTEETQKKFKKLLAYPSMLFIFITLLLLVFRNFFLPNMEALALSRNNGEDGFISLLPMIVSKIPDVIFATGGLIMLLILGFIHVYKKLTPIKKLWLVKRIPFVGKMYTVWKTRTFASELGSLLQSGLSMQNALDVLIEQHLDAVLSMIAKNVKKQVIFGEPFHSAVGLTEGLTKQFSSFAEHGADNGHLPKELMIYSESLDETIDRWLASGLAVLQPALFGLIAMCILAAYIALLLPVYGMIDKM